MIHVLIFKLVMQFLVIEMLRTSQLSIMQVLFWRLFTVFALICVGQLT